MGYSKKLYNVLGGLQVVYYHSPYLSTIPRIHKYYNLLCPFLYILHNYYLFTPIHRVLPAVDSKCQKALQTRHVLSFPSPARAWRIYAAHLHVSR